MRLALVLKPSAQTLEDLSTLGTHRNKELGTAFQEFVTGQPRGFLQRVANYLVFRVQEGSRLAAKLRTETEAVGDLKSLGAETVARYTTQLPGHHQSSKALVETVQRITEVGCSKHKITANTSPQSRVAIVPKGFMWASPRNLDGALPSLLNPVGFWEIKEYWGGGTKGGGSKMSDAIYEAELVGQELRSFEILHGGSRTKHYLLLDGKNQWLARMSDLRRAIDLLHRDLIDELIIGSEVMTEWPRIVGELCRTAKKRGVAATPAIAVQRSLPASAPVGPATSRTRLK